MKKILLFVLLIISLLSCTDEPRGERLNEYTFIAINGDTVTFKSNTTHVNFYVLKKK